MNHLPMAVSVTRERDERKKSWKEDRKEDERRDEDGEQNGTNEQIGRRCLSRLKGREGGRVRSHTSIISVYKIRTNHRQKADLLGGDSRKMYQQLNTKRDKSTTVNELLITE